MFVSHYFFGATSARCSFPRHGRNRARPLWEMRLPFLIYGLRRHPGGLSFSAPSMVASRLAIKRQREEQGILYHTQSTYPASLGLVRKPSFLKELEPNQMANAPNGKAHSVGVHCSENPSHSLLLQHHGSTSDFAVYDMHLQDCIRRSAVEEAKMVYSHSKASGYAPRVFICNRLMGLFVKSGSLADARNLFDEMTSRNPCSWSTLINGYSRSGNLTEARWLFERIPDSMRDSFSWSAIMSGYVHHGQPTEALGLLREMMSHERRECNKFMISTALAASTMTSSLSSGKEIHGHICRSEMKTDIVVWSTLSDMYAKCGRIDQARYVFDATPDRDTVSWTAMMGWYFDKSRTEEGFLLFLEMLRSRIPPNEFTCTAVLGACSHQAMETLGMQVHAFMISVGLECHPFAASALIHMYSKCGDVESCEGVFKEMERPDLTSWTSVIACYAQNGQPEMSLNCYESMLGSGIKPDQVVFVSVLSACAHAGLVEKGLSIFHSIENEHGIRHTPDHYACVVDLLSRAGKFDKAEEIMSKMQFKPNKFLWTSLLSASVTHRNILLARRAADALFEMEPKNPATFVTLANIYANAGMWDDVARLRKMVRDRGAMKVPGSSQVL